ncbi:putative signal transducing protein [Pontibacter liquoris]|uniref:putative signal transducing protein n=1 Tax=Pontibacter liquoris TaxID=2905677 RepID=UPI001FA70C06|nr:DUF2007 domain-containing protein [Pontibacter liquoris]
MAQSEESKPTEVFAGEFHRASLIRNMLEHHGIPAFVQNQYMGSIAPWQVAAGGLHPVKVIVSGMHRDQAQQLIEDFYNNLPGEE